MSIILAGVSTALALSAPQAGSMLLKVAATNIATRVAYDKVIKHRILQSNSDLSGVTSKLNDIVSKLTLVADRLYNDADSNNIVSQAIISRDALTSVLRAQVGEDEYMSITQIVDALGYAVYQLQDALEGIRYDTSQAAYYDRGDVTPGDTYRPLPVILDELASGLRDFHLHINALIPDRDGLQEYSESWHVTHTA